MEIFVIGMIGLALVASPFVLLVLHLIAHDRLKKLERAIGEVGEKYEGRLRELEGRLASLDASGEVGAAVPRQPAPASAVADDPSAFEAPVEAALEPAPTAVPTLPPTTARRPSVPQPSTRRAKSSRSSAEWEELIGGSWLNKIGAVVTVIGIALALAYSMRYLGPAGRVALALAASGAMLATGGLVEGRERYRVFARGLIGGGWAGLYFTTFAMHGLEAARIIDSPVLGTALLLAVAAGMVLHSLVYRSQTVTALAYFVTFATLAVAPATRFALFASLPAAASLLYIARRFRWPQMMVAGAVFTYGAYLVRGGAPDVGPEDWAFGQALLVVYWILFEAFDLLSLRRRAPGGLDETIMPLNAAGFIGASLLGWSATHPDSLWVFFVTAAGVFAASAALRVGQARTSRADNGDADGRLRGDGYEVALSIAAVMLALGIERGFDGWRQTVAWLLEAQLLVLSGLRLRNAFLRHLGSAVLAVPVLAVTFDDLPSSATFLALGRSWSQSTPVALLTAAVLYGDRALVRRSRGVRVAGLELLYNWVATFLVAAVLANELPDPWIAPAWFGLGLGLVAFSLTRGASELFLQGYALVGFAWLLTLLGNIPMNELVWGAPARWATALPMVVVMYLLSYRRRLVVGDEGSSKGEDPSGDDVADADLAIGGRGYVGVLADVLDRSSAAVLFGAATFLLSWFLLYEVSGSWLTVAWGLQGVSLLVAGFALRERRVRFAGLSLLGLCIVKLLAYDVAELEMIFRIFSFIILGALLLAVSFAYSRYREQIRRLL